ncbi:MAG: VOC family protein [Betaproteobacteria bacterium]|nr:VOC family protein [Betaproteobacteria bacterium]
MIDRFDHLHIQPADFDRSLAFYRDTLGWSVVASWGDPASGRGAVLSGGATKIVLAERSSFPAGAAQSRLSVHLDIHDIDKRFRELPPGDHVVSAPALGERGRRGFVVRDPDGNHIAFEELHGERG